MIRALTLPRLLAAVFLLLGLSVTAQRMQGIASYYADRFHNLPTSTGETFNTYGYMAASMELPFGTVVEVTNPANGKKVNVRINDCGPHRPDRIIDLSKAAARHLDLLKGGLVEVKLRVILASEAGPTCSRGAWSKKLKAAGKKRMAPPEVPEGLLGPVNGEQKAIPVVTNVTPPKPSISTTAPTAPAAPTTASREPQVGRIDPPAPTVGRIGSPAPKTGTSITYDAPTAPTTKPASPPPAPATYGNAPTAPSAPAAPPAETPVPEEEFSPDDMLFGVQVGAFSTAKNAATMVAQLKEEGFTTVWSVPVGKVHRVFAGKFYFPNQAEAHKKELREKGHSGATVRRVQ